DLVGGEPALAQEAQQFGAGGRLAARDDIGAGALAEERVGHGDHGGVVHPRVGEQVVLHLVGGHLFAAAVDLVLGAAFHDDVAGAVEAVRGERDRVVLGGLVVAADGVGAARVQFAEGSPGDLGAVAVDDADLVVGRDGPALGGGGGLLVVVVARVVD